jgi:hypothetical protein
MENSADGSGLLRHVIVVFQLTQNLRLADYHGIETCGDAKQVTHCVCTPIVIKVIVKAAIVWRRSPLVEETFNRLHGAVSLRPGSNHFDAIAGRKDYAFPNL